MVISSLQQTVALLMKTWLTVHTARSIKILTNVSKNFIYVTPLTILKDTGFL